MSKYSAALLHILLVVLAALAPLVDKGLTLVAVVQIAILVVASVGVYLLPLIQWKYAGALKVGASAIGAGLAALVPFLIQGTVTPSEWITVLLAFLGVIGVALGVDARATAIPAITSETVGQFNVTTVADPVAAARALVTAATPPVAK